MKHPVAHERGKLRVVCRRCGHTKHYWIKSQWNYECKKCRSRSSLRSRTIMQSSNLSFLIWYKAVFLLTAIKKGFSSKEIQRQLGLKCYEPVWAAVRKLRKAMGQRDDRYTLEGMIEMVLPWKHQNISTKLKKQDVAVKQNRM